MKDLKRYDIFGYPVYRFNIDGKAKFGSWTGILCTIFVLTVMVTFSVLKMAHLVKGKNPLIANSELTGQYQSERQTLDVAKFKFAFFIEDYMSNDPKDDPSMVELFGMIFHRDDDNREENSTIGVHRCDESDYRGFYPPVED